MKTKSTTRQPKRVVYLIGAGATQAEADYQGGEKINLLMRDSTRLGSGICTRIFKKTKTDNWLNENKKSKEEIDIEKLITLLASTDIEECRKKAENYRRLYYEEVLGSLAKAELLNRPELAMGLLEMYTNKIFQKKVERLAGIISLNHDNLFQVACGKVHNGINLGFEFVPQYFNKGSSTTPLIIKLHGAFNWINKLPIHVLKLSSKSEYSPDILWIPPTILKEAKDYPYNKLMGLAYEVLTERCDVLRIIGCSLSQNDWNIVALLFNAQYHQFFHKKSCFRIEFIMEQESGKKIMKECSYLKNMIPIGYLTEGDFSLYKYKEDERPKPSELDNPFKYWLKQTVQYHKNKGEFDTKNISKSLQKIIGE